MDTKLLKQKILDLAIHGKLVPQNPNDEPASKLLEKIREEKQKLIAEKKIKADKNDSYIFVGDDNRHYEKFSDGTVKDIEDEIPFEVPEGWAWCRLGKICDFIGGGTPDKSRNDFWNGTINWASVKDIKGNFLYSTEDKITEIGLKESSAHLASKGDIILVTRISPGKAIITQIETTINQDLKIVIPKTNLNKQFLLYFFQDSESYFIENSSGTTVKGIKLEFLISKLIPLPPLEEQERIVKEIEHSFTLINSLEKDKSDLQTAIKQAKSKILDLAIHGKLVSQDSSDEPASVLLEKLRAEKEAKIKAGDLKRDKNDSYIYKNTTDNCYYEKFTGKEPVCIDEEIPFDIPDNWQWCRLNELGETNIGLIYHPTDLVNTGVPVLRSNNIQNDCLCLDDLARVQTKILDNQYVADGDILICARNGSQALVGKCTLIKNIPEKMAFGAFMAVFRSKYNDYILRYLQSFYFKDYMRESNSTQIYQLTQAMLKNALIPLPPISEQKRIISKIEEMFKRLDQIQNNLI